jgi:hypothetical protein
MRELVDTALTQHPVVLLHLANGAVRYRLGDFAAALPRLEHAVRTTENWHDSFDEFYGTETAFFLAMAQRKAGHLAEAQVSLELAQARLAALNSALDKPYPDMVWKLEHIQREAETALRADASTGPPER